MLTPPEVEHDPCIPLLASVALVAFVGLVVWAIRKPKSDVGRRMGHVIYGLSLEWPAAFVAVIVIVLIHIVLSHHLAYLRMLRENRKSLGEAGVYLLLTVGALAFTSVRERRALKVLCLVVASLGLCLACAFKLAC
jgi:hypothetical protein